MLLLIIIIFLIISVVIAGLYALHIDLKEQNKEFWIEHFRKQFREKL